MMTAKNTQNLPAFARETEADWLNDLRERGLTHFNTHGFPTPAIEKWKYTSLKQLAQADMTPDVHHGRSTDAAHIPAPLLDIDTETYTARLVVVNGVYREDLSDTTMAPASVTLKSLDDVIATNPQWVHDHMIDNGFNADQVMLALNGHFFTDGFVVHVTKNAELHHPIEILSYTDADDGDIDQATATYPRHMIVVDEGAQATIVEHHIGKGTYIANSGYDIHVGSNATLHHYRWQNETDTATHISTTNVNTGRDASYDGFTLTTGAALSRNEVHGKIIGDNAELRVNGTYLLKDKQHGDTTILVDHIKPHGVSNQTFKGILDDRAVGVFQGKVFVEKQAQKTDGYQLNNAMLLSDTAQMNVKPELEIYADDVRCSHGATTGQIDEGPLFYLRSRGLNEQQARKMLMQAFLGEALIEIRNDAIRDLFTEKAAEWLDAHVKAKA